MYWLTGILGLLLGVAPFVMGYNDHTAALWTSVLLGAVVVVLSILEGIDSSKRQWEYWAVGIAGLAAVIAPFIFGFSSIIWAMWVMVALGLLMLFVSGYEVFTEQTTTR